MKKLINKYKFKSLKHFNNLLNSEKMISVNQAIPMSPPDRYIFAYKLLNETIFQVTLCASGSVIVY